MLKVSKGGLLAWNVILLEMGFDLSSQALQ